MKNIDFINEYIKMKNLSDICKEIKYDRSNIVSGRAPDEKIEIVAKKCKSEIVRMYNIIVLGDEICQ